jgi:hypothetical protein
MGLCPSGTKTMLPKFGTDVKLLLNTMLAV